MTKQELIKALKDAPENLPIRLICKGGYEEDEDLNMWVTSVEVSHTGESGYECIGEIRLLGSE